MVSGGYASLTWIHPQYHCRNGAPAYQVTPTDKSLQI